MLVLVPSLSASHDDVLWFRTGHGRLYWRARETPQEEPETNQWIATFRKTDVFYDVGANIGLYAMAAARFRGIPTVAVEPDLMNARMLYENVLRNDLGKLVTVLPVALDSKSQIGTLFLKTLSYGDALHNLEEPSAYVRQSSGFAASVPVFAVDDLIGLLGLPQPTRVKIDVDGRELQILEGFKQSLSGVHEVLVEVDLDRQSAQAITELLCEKGFRVVGESAPLVPWNRFVNRIFRR
jgi:FkbM family methyltransferase